MPAEIAVGILCVIAIGAAAVLGTRAKVAESPRSKAIGAPLLWTLITVVGLTIWLIARAQVAN